MARFQKGQGGRPRGARNRRTLEFKSVLAKHDFCPASALIECFLEAKKIYDNYGVIYDAIVEARDKDGTKVYPLEDNAHKYLKIAADIAKDLTSYTYPKLKSLEQNIKTTVNEDRPLEHLSDEELERLRVESEQEEEEQEEDE